MKLYRMDDEVSIAGTVEELQKVYRQLETVSKNDQLIFSFDIEGEPAPFDVLESTMAVKVGNAPVLAIFQKELGLVVEGNVESIQSFASVFDFESDAEIGCHNHWDEACDSGYVAAGTLPIVVSVA